MANLVEQPSHRSAITAAVALAGAWLTLGSFTARATVDYLAPVAVEEGWETHWLRVTARGVESLATLPHLVVFANDELWAWRSYHFQLPTCPCPDPGGDLLGLDLPECQERPGGDALQLVGLASGDQAEVVGIRSGPAEAGERQSVTLLGAVGPVLLLRVDLHEVGCGDHGRILSRFVAFHAGARRGVDLLQGDELGRIQLRERTQGWQVLRRDAAAYPIGSAADVELTATLADFRSGELALSYQFSVAACHECSDGRWSSGTRSARIPAQEFPARVAPFAEMPQGVRDFLVQRVGSVPQDREIAAGVSAVRATPERVDELLTAFREPSALDRPPEAGTDPRYGERSGMYASDSGELAVMLLPETAATTYTSVFQTVSTVPHMCDCDLQGPADGDGYLLGEHGTRLEVGEGWARLTGPAPECCGLGWEGDELVRAADLPRCTVTAETAKLFEDPLGETPLRTFVIQGNVVSVLAPRAGARPEFLLIRLRGELTHSTGWLHRDALSCSGLEL